MQGAKNLQKAKPCVSFLFITSSTTLKNVFSATTSYQTQNSATCHSSQSCFSTLWLMAANSHYSPVSCHLSFLSFPLDYQIHWFYKYFKIKGRNLCPSCIQCEKHQNEKCPNLQFILKFVQLVQSTNYER